MSSVDRQNSLLVAEDWKKIYQTFREADFQSYDFETLRKTMIDYLRLYYPEDFNDFIESSEYIALIDLIAFLGQSLAFRTDLNSRENFLDTAERRDSILKLARLVGYSPKRSIPASGLLKIVSVSTTEAITDSNGYDLANLPVVWNDVTNSNWFEQFTLIVNATLLDSQIFGKSGNSQLINGIKTDEYTINITPKTLPAFNFSATVGGSSTEFEIVSATSVNQSYIYEVPPKPVSKFNLLYRNDSQGNGSINTGFFAYFKQGRLQTADFTVSEALPNRVLNIGYSNINNTDVWLYDVNSSNVATNKWTAVPAIAGVNVIYNKSTDRNLYQVNTTTNDQIDLVFGDGSFANVPQGTYRLYFRTSSALSYKVTPDEIQNAAIAIPYISRSGVQETLTIRANLNYTVANASANETNDEIRAKAPQQYYSQGRMITGEDYNIVPFTSFSNILKVKSVNRTSSGVSRFLDVNDSSGKYSSTNIFAQDGYLYKSSQLASNTFTFLSSSGVQSLVRDELTTILSSKEMQHFYYENVTRNTSSGVTWQQSSINSDGCTGFMYLTGDTTTSAVQLGSSTSASTRDVKIGAIIRFAAPIGKCFNSQNQIASRTPKYTGDKLYIYGSVTSIVGDGTLGGAVTTASKSGPVTLSVKVPSSAIVDEIIPVFNNRLDSSLVSAIVLKILSYNNFALRYDLKSSSWLIVDELYLSSATPWPEFDYATAGSPTDNSWMIRFEYSTNVGYNIYWRSTNYYFESLLETKFYFDEKVKTYDSKTGTTVQDTITVLKVNSSPNTKSMAASAADSAAAITTATNALVTASALAAEAATLASLSNSESAELAKIAASNAAESAKIAAAAATLAVNAATTAEMSSWTPSLGVDYTWNIYKNIVDIDGYENQSKVLLTFTDTNADGIPDNPDLFDMIVAPKYDKKHKLVFFEREVLYGGFVSYAPSTVEFIVDYEYYTDIENIYKNNDQLEGYVYYATAENTFFKIVLTNGVKTLVKQSIYRAYVGRGGPDKLYFQYKHNSPNYRRIDPSPSNVIDIYLLTKVFASDYQSWIRDTTGTIEEPVVPTTDELTLAYSKLEGSKATSDAIVFNSAKFKSLFGAKANPALQATFKVVKNAALNLSDNDIKSSVVNAINTYFAVDNWDFGETFYFSELSAYLHTTLSPNVSSIIIVPVSPTAMFGSLYQINAEANEILSSSATVDNVEIISAITAASINANFAAVNSSITLGTL